MTLLEPNPFGVVTTARRFGVWHAEPVLVRWDLVVLSIDRGPDPVLLSIPGPELAEMLARLEAGDLDDDLDRALDARGRLGTLSVDRDPPRTIGLHDRLDDDPRRLVPAERDPSTGNVGGTGRGSREHKHRSEDATPAPTPGSARRLPVRLVAATALALVVIIVAAIALTGDEGDEADPPEAAETATSTTSPDPQPPDLEPLGGTYDLVTTIIDGNDSLPVGTTSTGSFTLTVDCSTTPCTITADGGLGVASVVGPELRFTGTGPEPCPSDPSIQATDVFALTLSPTADGLAGELTLETVDAGGCPEAVLDPVVFRWEATRRPDS